MYIVVAGMMGAGKSTLVKQLSQVLGPEWTPIMEPVEENPYLEPCYSDPTRWSFTLQIQYLMKRHHLHLRAQTPGHCFVLDRSIYEGGGVFVNARAELGWMTPDEKQTYLGIEEVLIRGLEPPNLLLYLKRPPEQVREMIRRRGRAYEQKAPEALFQAIERHYESWFDAYSRGPKLLVDAAQREFVKSPGDLKWLRAEVAAKLN